MSNNEILDNENEEQAWVFPDLDGPLPPVDGFHLLLNETNETPSKDIPETSVISETEEEKRLKELGLEREKMVAEHENKMSVIVKIIEKIRNPLSIIDDEMTDIIIDMVKQISKKIILKEIELDKKVINDVIDDLKSYIPSHNQIISIAVSDGDYARLNVEQHHLKDFLTANSSLNVGDVIVKSNYTEVRAMVDDRINQILRTSHE